MAPTPKEKVIVRWRSRLPASWPKTWYTSRPMSYKNARSVLEKSPHLDVIIHRCKEAYYAPPTE